MRLHRFKIPLKARSSCRPPGSWMSPEMTPRKLLQAIVVDGRRACPHALHSPASELQPIRWAAIRTCAGMVLGTLMKPNGDEILKDLKINPQRNMMYLF